MVAAVEVPGVISRPIDRILSFDTSVPRSSAIAAETAATKPPRFGIWQGATRTAGAAGAGAAAGAAVLVSGVAGTAFFGPIERTSRPISQQMNTRHTSPNITVPSPIKTTKSELYSAEPPAAAVKTFVIAILPFCRKSIFVFIIYFFLLVCQRNRTANNVGIFVFSDSLSPFFR